MPCIGAQSCMEWMTIKKIFQKFVWHRSLKLQTLEVISECLHWMSYGTTYGLLSKKNPLKNQLLILFLALLVVLLNLCYCQLVFHQRPSYTNLSRGIPKKNSGDNPQDQDWLKGIDLIVKNNSFYIHQTPFNETITRSNLSKQPPILK